MPRKIIPDGRGHTTLSDDTFATDLAEYKDLAADIKRLTGLQKALREKITKAMTEVGSSAIEAGGYRAAIYHRDYFGFSTTDADGREVDPDEIDARRETMARFFKKYAPDLYIPASDKISKAWEAYLNTLPEEKREGTEPPPWLKIAKTPTLRISGAGADDTE